MGWNEREIRNGASLMDAIITCHPAVVGAWVVCVCVFELLFVLVLAITKQTVQLVLMGAASVAC